MGASDTENGISAFSRANSNFVRDSKVAKFLC